MSDQNYSPGYLDLLNDALARELHVSIQYMLQHAAETGYTPTDSGKTLQARQSRFITVDSLFWPPGPSLKKIAISEMKHAEAIAERIVVLGGQPTTDPGTVSIGNTAAGMLENDREQELEAIELYGRIIEAAGTEGDQLTENLFRRILSDEEKHYRIFSDLLE